MICKCCDENKNEFNQNKNHCDECYQKFSQKRVKKEEKKKMKKNGRKNHYFPNLISRKFKGYKWFDIEKNKELPSNANPCYEIGLYSDLIEDKFFSHNIESDITDIFDKILGGNFKLETKEKRKIKNFLITLYFRNPLIINHYSKPYDKDYLYTKYCKESLSRNLPPLKRDAFLSNYKELIINNLEESIKYMKTKKGKILDINKLDIDDLIKIHIMEGIPNGVMKYNTKTQSKFDKFGLKTIVNDTKKNFYLSDNILQLNIYLGNKNINGKKYSICENNIFGLDVKGIILILPISPKLALIFYDSSTYDIENGKHIVDEKYINYINLLLLKNSYKYYASDSFSIDLSKEETYLINLDFIKLKAHYKNISFLQKIPLIEGFEIESNILTLDELLNNNNYK